MSATLRCSVGELAVTGSSYLRLVARGNWTGILEFASPVAPAIGERVTVTVLPEAASGAPAPSPDLFAGTVRYARQVPGSDTLVCRVVGGAGRLFASLPQADQVAGATVLPAGLVLRKMVDAAGETLATGVEQALDAYLLPHWHRAGGISARDAIDLLIYDLATVTGLPIGWRVLADGTVWAGVETWPAASGSFVYIEQGADDGVMVYAPSGAPLRPGTTVLGERAIEVFYQLATPAMRALVRRGVPGDPAPGSDPQTLAALSLYSRSWGARVEAQNADGTLELVCDDARMGELHAVPFRMGIPGASVTLPAGPAGVGARVRLRFQDSSPRGAYACDVDQDPTATQPLALVGDATTYFIGTAPPGGGAVVFAVVPQGTPNSVALTIAGPGHRYARGVSGL